jgi:DNA-binding NarL/FixJ family response regulator
MKNVKVLIAEDQVLVAKLINAYLNESDGIEVIGVCSTGKDALEFVTDNGVDIVLMDVMMPDMDGIQATEVIAEDFANSKVIMMSAKVDNTTIQKALSSGASGYISKSASCEDVINAIRTVEGGGCYFCKDSIKALSTRDLPKKENNVFGKKLTKREKEVMNLIGLGFSNSEIANKLCLSKRTVETHRRNILHKFGEKNFIGLMRTLVEFSNGEGGDIYRDTPNFVTM